MRKHKVEIALLILVPALAIWLFVVDKGSVTTREAELRKRNLLQAFRREQIETIVFEQGDKAFRLVKRVEDGDSMYYVARDGKNEEIADQSAVDRLVATLEFAVPDRKIDEPIDKKALGLSSPRLRMKLGMGRISYDLSLGAEAPSPKGAVYAELAGLGVVVVPRDLVTQLSLSADNYRSRTLVPYLSPDLARLDIDGPGGERHFVRGSWGGWELEGTPRIRADREVLDRILSAFAEIRSEAFLSDEEADQALSQEHVTITMVPREEGRARGLLQIGGECPGQPESVVVIRREPSRISACAPRGVMPALSTPREALIDKNLFSFRPDEVERIGFTEGDRKLEIARNGASWRMHAPSESEVEADAGNALARAIHTLEASRIVADADLKALGLLPPRATATATKAVETNDEPGAVEVVELGAVKGNFVYARRQTDGAVLELGRDVARALEPNQMALKSRRITEIPLARVRKVGVEAGDFRQAFARTAAGSWKLESPSGFDVDAATAVDIAEALGSLTADKWIADNDDGSFGFAKPRAIYVLEAAADGESGNVETIRILVGAPAAGGYFAKREGQAGVFVLPKPVARRAESYAIDRAYFLIVPSELRKVMLRSGGKTITLQRAGDRFVADGDTTLSPERIARIVDKLGELRALGASKLGTPRKEEGFDKPQLEIEIERQLAGALKPESLKLVIGAGDSWQGTSVHYARRAGVDASFALAQSEVRAILDAM